MKVEMNSWIVKLLREHVAEISVLSIGFVMLLLMAADKMLLVQNITSVNFNWWLGFLYELLPWVLATLVPLLLLGRLSVWGYVIAVPVYFFLECIEWFVHLNFGMVLDGDWVGIILGSSRREFLWFVEQYLTVRTFCVVAILGLMTWGLIRILRLARNIHAGAMTVCCALLSACVFVYATPVRQRGAKVFNSLSPVNLVVDSVLNCKAYVRLSKMKKSPRIPETVHLQEGMDDVIGVFVLGESATRNHWGLYGYGRDTTPNAVRRKSELVVFSDLVTPGWCTSETMRYLLTTRTIEDNDDFRFTLPQVLRRAGYGVSLFTNQERWGEFEGDESFVFAGCDPLTFMGERGETNRYDEVLLKYVDGAINARVARQIVFVHLIGSHFPCDVYYPHAHAPFVPENVDNYSKLDTRLMQNHYDNSISYTDSVIEGAITALEKTGRPCWMIYLSDHGETPSSKRWRAYADRDYWEVPFIVWLSEEFREKYPDKVKRLENARGKPLQSDQLMYGLLEFAGVEGLGALPEKNFMDDGFKPRKPRMILSGNDVYRWECSGK